MSKRFFPYSLIPIAGSVLVVSFLSYVAVIALPDYSLSAWSGLFTDLMPLYLGIIAGVVVINCAYVYFRGRGKYNFTNTLFVNIGGFLIALVTYLSWYAF